MLKMTKKMVEVTIMMVVTVMLTRLFGFYLDTFGPLIMGRRVWGNIWMSEYGTEIAVASVIACFALALWIVVKSTEEIKMWWLTRKEEA